MHVLDNRDHLSWGDAHLLMLTAEHHTHTRCCHIISCGQSVHRSGSLVKANLVGYYMLQVQRAWCCLVELRLAQSVEWHSVSLRDKVAAKRSVS